MQRCDLFLKLVTEVSRKDAKGRAKHAKKTKKALRRLPIGAQDAILPHKRN